MVTATDWKPKILTVIDQLADLTEGWDGEKARPMNPEIIQAAKDLIGRLVDDCEIKYAAPFTRGTLQLEVDTQVRSVELEFVSPDIIRVLKWCPDEEVYDEYDYRVECIEHTESLIRWAHGR